MREKTKKLLRWSDRTIEFSLWAMVFALPFSKSIVEISFVAAMISWVVKRSIMRGFQPVLTGVNLQIFVFTILGFLSMLTSTSLPLSLEGFFFKLSEWIMIYFIVAESINTKEKLNRILLVMLTSALLITIDGIFQAVMGVDFIRGYSLIANYVIRASFDNPNGFGAWLVATLSLAFSLACFSKNKKRHLLWILICQLIFCLVFTYSRGAWMASLISLMFLGLIRSKKLLLIMILLVLILSFIMPVSVKQRADSIMKISRTNTDRFTLWQEAINITTDFPLLGSGLNTYASIAPSYKLTKETGVYPHNSYLHMAAESGLLGLGAFLWILVRLFRTSIANIRRINDKFYEAALVGLLAGLFGLLAHSFVDTDLYSLQLGNLMWFIMGLIVAVQRVALQKNLP